MAEVEDAIADQGVPKGRLRVSAALGHGHRTLGRRVQWAVPEHRR
jgi:hypothetical protein